jgi:hypothetical protein
MEASLFDVKLLLPYSGRPSGAVESAEPFSSSDFRGLEDVNCLGELPSTPGRQQSLRRTFQVLS